MVRILVFGASTAYGAWDAEGGWADRLKRHCHEKTIQGKMYCLVYNLGISGASTDEMLVRFQSESRERMKESERTIFIIAAGTNDARFIRSKGRNDVPPGKFRQNLTKLIALARKRSTAVLIIGPTPVDQSKTDPVPWDRNHSFRNADITKYNAIMESVCSERHVHFIDMLDAMKGASYLSDDGLHPGTKGHARMFRIILRSLVEKKVLQ